MQEYPDFSQHVLPKLQVDEKEAPVVEKSEEKEGNLVKNRRLLEMLRLRGGRL